MSVPRFMSKLLHGGGRRKQALVKKPIRSRLALEALEERSLLSTVAISQFTNPDGTLGLRVVTSGKEPLVQERRPGLASVVRANRPSATDPNRDARHLAALGDAPPCVRPEEAAGASASGTGCLRLTCFFPQQGDS